MHRLFQGLSYVLNKNVATQSEAQRLHLRSPPRAARAIRPGPDGGLGLWGLWARRAGRWAVGGGRWAVGAAAVVAARMSSASRWTLCARSALRLCGLRTTWSESTGTARASTFCLMPRIGCTSTTPKANQPVRSGLLVAPQLGSPVSAAEPAELLRALERRAGAAQVSTRRLPCLQRAPKS